jgi:hypothetical protein
MASPFLYFPGERLSYAELSAARLEGMLVELGEGYIPADAVETAALRAASLAPLLRRDAAATHASAAWIHGVLPAAPGRHTIQRVADQRTRQRIDRRYVYRDPRLPPEDVQIMGGVAVTTPGRTVADLARLPPTDGDEALAAFVREDPGAVEEAVGWLARAGRVPQKRVALARLMAGGTVRMT